MHPRGLRSAVGIGRPLLGANFLDLGVAWIDLRAEPAPSLTIPRSRVGG
jgi:hypothetical protein